MWRHTSKTKAVKSYQKVHTPEIGKEMSGMKGHLEMYAFAKMSIAAVASMNGVVTKLARSTKSSSCFGRSRFSANPFRVSILTRAFGNGVEEMGEHGKFCKFMEDVKCAEWDENGNFDAADIKE